MNHEPPPLSPPKRDHVPADDARLQQTAAFSPENDTLTDRPNAPSPVRFGRYELLRLLGQGGMGEVHLAHDTLLQRTVALKLPKFADDHPVHRERFFREARAAAVLTHPNICPVYDVGEIDGRPYLTMAYIEGPTLSQHLRDVGPLPCADAARLIATVAGAMQHAHSHGILHRDLKPSNILLNAAGEPIVMDFGLAFRFDADTGERLTQQGLVVGTPAYMPPEQVNGQTMGPTADVYSLCVVLYEMLTGRVPFQGALGQVLAHVEHTAPTPPSQLRPEIDWAAEAICLKGLAKSPAKRFADMATLARTLDDYTAGRPVDLPMPAMVQAAARRQRRRRLALIGTMLLATVAAVAIALAWRRAEAEQADELAKTQQQLEFQQLYTQLAKPIVKMEYVVAPAAPATIARRTLPASLLAAHDGPLYFMISGSGPGHVIDLSDQLGQGMQVQRFVAGDITVLGPYLTFLGDLNESCRVYIKSGLHYGILAPMASGLGCPHVEFDGSHLLMPKINGPHVESTAATGAELTSLRNPRLTQKVTLRYDNALKTTYTVFARPEVQIVPGEHEARKQAFPEIHALIELDRQRQMNAPTISWTAIARALSESTPK